MRRHTARAIAYVAARLHTGKQAGAVYDFTAGKHISMSGTVQDAAVNVYDFDQGCFLGGSGSGGNFSLYHYGDGAHVSLKRAGGGRFSGFDYLTGSHYSLTVTSSSVSFYDFADGTWANYSI